jgi:CubicO group peptidase (beta-lactamase class C family)
MTRPYSFACWFSSAVLATIVFGGCAGPAPDDALTTEVDAGRDGELPQARALPATAACLDASLAAGVAAGSFSGLSAQVVVDGRLLLQHNAGVVAPGSAQPVGSATRFRIASTTKMMTATAMLSLVDQGLVSLDRPVVRTVPTFSLPGAPGWSDSLTPRMLINQTGELDDYITIDGPRDDGALAAAFRDPAFVARVPIWAPPGSFWNYSNQNLIVAGLVSEAASGKLYRQLLRDAVFTPLAMSRAAFTPAEVLADPDYASGMDGTEVYGPAAYDNAWARPAGWTWASTDDLMKFARFLLDGDARVLSPASWRSLTARQVNTANLLDLAWYGYGLFVDDYLVLAPGSIVEGARVVSHGGNLPGYTTLLSTLPEQRFGFVAVANGSNLDLSPCFRVAVAETVAARLPPPQSTLDLKIERARFSDYVGHYDDPVGATGPADVSLSAAGDLVIRFPTLDELGVPYNPALQAVSQNNFAFTIQGLTLQLTGIRQGTATPIKYLRTREFVLHRAAAAPAVNGPTPPSIAPALRRARLERALRPTVRESSAQPFELLPRN